MKLYGWDDCGVARGELLATQVDVVDLDFGLEILAAELGWERAFTAFAEAKRALIASMQAECVDEELIRAIRQCKASYVPEV